MPDTPCIFERYGRTRHLRIADHRDLARAAELDEALWVATGAPLDTLDGDPVLMKQLDHDGSGRVLADELRGAIRWALACLADPSGIDQARADLRPDQVRGDHPDGRRARESIEKILDREPGDGTVTLEQVRRIASEIEARPVSGAGVVLPEAGGDPATRELLETVIATTGGADHPGGRPGVDARALASFLEAARARLAWLEAAEETSEPPRHPLGEATGAAWAAVEAVRAKIESYFALCRALALDPAFAGRLPPTSEERAATDLEDPEAVNALLARAPLAEPGAGAELPLEGAVNPAWQEALDRFRRLAAAPALGEEPETLTPERWSRVLAFFDGYRRWREAETGQPLAGLDPGALRACLEPERVARARAVIETGRETAFGLENLRLLERLLLHQTHLLRLANNFVSFPYLYRRHDRAMFEMGTLVMDGRRFSFAVRVLDRAEHALLAKTSRMYVLYVEATRPAGGERMELAVPVTAGGQGNLSAGKRGIFIGTDGRMWAARVVQIIENPISLREAIASPFKRLGALLGGKFEALAAGAEKQLDATGTGTVAAVESAVTGQASPAPAQPPPPAPPAARAPAGGGGMLVSASIAIAALGSAAAFVTRTLADLHWLTLAGGLAGAIAAVILPMLIIGFLDLRRRDLAAILEGSGWSINARMRLTFALGRLFTHRPAYPGDGRALGRRRRRRILLIGLAALAAAGLASGAWYVFLAPGAENGAPAEPSETRTAAPGDPGAAPGPLAPQPP